MVEAEAIRRGGTLISDVLKRPTEHQRCIERSISESPAGSVANYLCYLDHNWPGAAVVIETEEHGLLGAILDSLICTDSHDVPITVV